MKLCASVICVVVITLLVCDQVESKKKHHGRHGKHGKHHKHRISSRGDKNPALTFEKFVKSNECENSPVYRLFMFHYRVAVSKPGLQPAERGENFLWLKDLADAVKEDGTEGQCPAPSPPRNCPQTRASGRSLNASPSNTSADNPDNKAASTSGKANGNGIVYASTTFKPKTG